MSKKELNLINYILANVNYFNTIDLKIRYNCYVYIINFLERKNINFEIKKEKTENFDIIEINLKNYYLQVELTDKNKLKILYFMYKKYMY